jgi:hypothetical protein
LRKFAVLSVAHPWAHHYYFCQPNFYLAATACEINKWAAVGVENCPFSHAWPRASTIA